MDVGIRISSLRLGWQCVHALGTFLIPTDGRTAGREYELDNLMSPDIFDHSTHLIPQ